MTGSSSAVNREDPRMSPRPSPRKGSLRPKEKAPERKDNDSLSIGSDSRSRSGSLSSTDSSDQLQEGRSKFERVMLSGYIGSLSNHDDDGNEKRHHKLYRVYLDPLNFSNEGDLDHVNCR